MSQMVECDICCRMVADEDRDSVNAAVLGDSIAIIGHRVCLSNINRLIVIPNRAGLSQLAVEMHLEKGDGTA